VVIFIYFVFKKDIDIMKNQSGTSVNVALS
jgi:hypothetical protein